MEQETTVEQETLNAFTPYSNCTISQPVIFGGPSYLPHQTTRTLSSRETRRLIFEYLKQVWSLDTDALTIAKEKRDLFHGISLKERELLERHEGKSQTQDRSNKSLFKRQRRF
jgi:hypothetical protein